MTGGVTAGRTGAPEKVGDLDFLVQERRSSRTIVWTSHKEPAEAASAFSGLLDSGKVEDRPDHPSVVLVDQSGTVERTYGYEAVTAAFERLERAPWSVAVVRIEAEVRGVGHVSCGYQRTMPGIDSPLNCYFLTAESLDRDCLYSVFTQIADEKIHERYEQVRFGATGRPA